MKRLIRLFLYSVMLGNIVTSCSTFNSARAINAGATLLQATAVNDEMIKTYVKEFINKSDQTNTVCGPTDNYAKRLEKIVSGLDNKEINFKVYKTDQVNAFACADGSVRIYTGLMDIMSDDEILGVIGHEIGHVMKKHTKNAYKMAIVNAAIREGIASTSSTAAVISDSQLGAFGVAVMNSGFSKKQEFAADDYGYNFLKKCGKNPLAMAKSFKKLKSLEERGGSAKMSGLEQLLSTHPQLDARIKRMEEKAAADGYVNDEK